MEGNWSVGGGSIVYDAEGMRALAELSEEHGFDEAAGAVAAGDWSAVAHMLMGMDGYDGPGAARALEAILADKPGPFSVRFLRGGRVYEAVTIDDEPTWAIVEGGGKSLRSEARMVLNAAIQSDPRAVEGEGASRNLYRVLSGMAKEQGAPGLFGICATEPEPVRTRDVVRETVIIKEEPPELERMLRQSFADVLVKASVEDMVPRIKQRLMDEFGFEPITHEVVMADGRRKVEGVVHECFDQVLHYVANGVPVMLYSPPGAGKNVLCKQVADSLGLKMHFMNSVTDEYKVTGFIDAGGTYRGTPFYRAFKDGGLFFLDEIDASAPEILVCLNAAIANGYFAFPHETVEAHEDFRVVAAGNTLGTGDTSDAMYTGRMKLDAASLNRFVNVKMGYDRAIDAACADNDMELCDFIWEYRKVTDEMGLPCVASYRNIAQIKVAEAAIPLETALAQCLTKEMGQDDIAAVAARMTVRNRYARALSGVVAL